MRLGETNAQLRAAYASSSAPSSRRSSSCPRPCCSSSAQVLVLPIIGALDHERAQQIDDRLLAAVRENRARVV